MTRELAALLLAYAAVAALVAAARPPARLPLALRRIGLLRAAAAAGLVGALAARPMTDGLFFAALHGVLGLSAAATAFVLLAPVAPRAAWGAALLAPLAAAALLAARWL